MQWFVAQIRIRYRHSLSEKSLDYKVASSQLEFQKMIELDLFYLGMILNLIRV